MHAERGAITKGSIEYQGNDIANSDAYNLVKDGVVQVLEGRHCFSHLTVEENIMTGSSLEKTQKRQNKILKEFMIILKELELEERVWLDLLLEENSK